MSDYDIETTNISTTSGATSSATSGEIQTSDTHVIDLNIKSESNPSEQDIVKSEPLENESIAFCSQDLDSFLLTSADGGPPAAPSIGTPSGGGIDFGFFLGGETSGNFSADSRNEEISNPYADSNFIKEELILVRNEIENNTGNKTGHQSVDSHKSDKFKCYHCGENFANISSLNAHAAHIHNICIHKCPYCPGDGAKFKFRTHLVEHIMLNHPGKSLRIDDSARVQIATDFEISKKSAPDRHQFSRTSWFVKTKCEICGEEFRKAFKIMLTPLYFSLSDWLLDLIACRDMGSI